MSIVFGPRPWLRFAVAAAMTVLSFGAHAQTPTARGPACAGIDYNRMILGIVRSLPQGGGYTLGDDLQLPAIRARNIGAGHWEMKVYDGHPSHCTSATYTVYAHLAEVLQNRGSISLDADQIEMLEARNTMANGRHLVDGQGPFWIFNSNGAGAAALLKHTGTGFSFRDDKLIYARPGDFLKMFWNDNVGASESGHQVVYLGSKVEDGRDLICFWGSQRRNKSLYLPAANGAELQDGYGEACRPRSDIKAMVFSRVTCMEHLAAGLRDMSARAAERGPGPLGLRYPFMDEYLMNLRETSSDHATLERTYEILPAPDAFADVMAGAAR